MPSPYPSIYQVEEMFGNRVSDPSLFHTYFANNFTVTVNGTDFHLKGHHTDTDTFHSIYTRIVDHLKVDTLKVEVVRVIGGGESAWATVVTNATALTRSDKPFHHEWVDLVRFDSHGKIVQMKEYLDTGLIGRHLDEHEVREEGGKK
ncbi:MAG: hypothetical protein Q9191_008306 [Dirinaria sp. TL-2023a]